MTQRSSHPPERDSASGRDRRSRFRVGCRAPVTLYRDPEGDGVAGVCRNLSGAGMGLVCDESFAAGEVLAVVFTTGSTEVRTRGRVVRASTSAPPGEARVEVAIEFEHADPALEDQLVQRVLDTQRVIPRLSTSPLDAE